MTVLGVILPWFQIIAAALLVTAILLQRSGGDAGAAFGGSSGGVFYSKRGLEKTLFKGTIVLAVIFVVVNFLALFV